MTPRKNEQSGRFLGRTALMIAAVAVVALVALAQQGRSEPKGADPARDRVMSRQKYSKPPVEQLHRSLTPLQFEVTQRAATEPPFGNAFWDNHERGLYVDVATGEPLFSSTDKFESGTGWPSFTRPVEVGRVVERRDTSAGMLRAEVRSQGGDSHLGHVFDDGPAPTHLRYCINSAALRFIPAAKLAAAGYGAYAPLFADASAARAATPASSLSSTSATTMSPAAATPSAPASASPAGGGAPTPNNCTLPGPGQKPGCTPTLETAILAGGCFWGMEDILRKIPGVVQTEVGYTGGKLAHPTYEDVHTGDTGHAESVRIVFDPRKLSYADLLEKWFFRMHDPTTRNRQGNDVGSQYRSAIFVTSPAQRRTAEAAKVNAAKSGRWKNPIVTEIVDAGPFTLAEAYHQKYLAQNPGGYTCHYLRD